MTTLSNSELELLGTLTWKVRVAADSQLAQMLRLSDCQLPSLIRSLKRLDQRGLLDRNKIAIALFEPKAPLVNWLPGQPESNWQSISWQLQRRWQELAPARTWVNWATRKAAAVVGGVGGGLRQPLQLQHDLAVTSVYVARQLEPGDGEVWVGEDVYRSLPPREARTTIPDALIMDDRYRLLCAVELGGLYSPKRLSKFHRHWAIRHTPYEIW
jgi:hypothetical protein